MHIAAPAAFINGRNTPSSDVFAQIVATSCTRIHRSLVHLVDAALVPWYPTIAAAVANNTNLSNFVAAVNAEGSYVSVVDGSTPFIGTIFAPTNA